MIRFLTLTLQATLHLAVPAKTPAGAPIFVAGTFNQWDPGASAYRLRPQSDGQFAIEWERDGVVLARRVERGPRVDPESFGPAP